MSGNYILLLIFFTILIIAIDLSDKDSLIKKWLKKRKKKQDK